MKKIKLIIAWAISIILFIATIPITIIILGVADMEYFWSDYYENKPAPKYFTNWFKFIIFPFYLFNIKNSNNC